MRTLEIVAMLSNNVLLIQLLWISKSSSQKGWFSTSEIRLGVCLIRMMRKLRSCRHSYSQSTNSKLNSVMYLRYRPKSINCRNGQMLPVKRPSKSVLYNFRLKLMPMKFTLRMLNLIISFCKSNMIYKPYKVNSMISTRTTRMRLPATLRLNLSLLMLSSRLLAYLSYSSRSPF